MEHSSVLKSFTLICLHLVCFSSSTNQHICCLTLCLLSCLLFHWVTEDRCLIRHECTTTCVIKSPLPNCNLALVQYLISVSQSPSLSHTIHRILQSWPIVHHRSIIIFPILPPLSYIWSTLDADLFPILQSSPCVNHTYTYTRKITSATPVRFDRNRRFSSFRRQYSYLVSYNSLISSSSILPLLSSTAPDYLDDHCKGSETSLTTSSCASPSPADIVGWVSSTTAAALATPLPLAIHLLPSILALGWL